MAKFNITPEVLFIDRKGWGAKDIPRKGHRVARDTRTHVIIHHTVIIDNDATPNQWENEREVFKKMQQLQTIRPDLGKDVPYNFVVFLMNTAIPSIIVCEGRGEDRSGAHTSGHNTKGIGVSLEGDFENHNINVAPYAPLISLFLGWLKFDPNNAVYGGPYDPMKHLGDESPEGDRKVFAHKDFKATNCPGKHVDEILDQIDFIKP